MLSTKVYYQYESIRHRLVSAPRAGKTMQIVDGLLSIADDFDTFLFDAYGVLNVGDGAINGAAEVISLLQKQGKNCFVVSNAAGFEKSFYPKKYAKLGYNFSIENIVVSRDAVVEGLERFDKTIRWGLIGASEHQNDLYQMDIQRIDQDAPDFLQADGFIFSSPHRWNEEKQAAFVAALEENPRPVLLGNPDMIAPMGERSSIEPGSYVLTLPDRVFEQVHVFGKPFPAIYSIVVNRLEKQGKVFNPTRTLMLGDTLHTDILGGNSFGIKTALVYGHGFFKGLDYQHYVADSGITPDFAMTQI